MRQAKPTAVLKLEGNYRPARHAGRVDETPLAGEPVKPEGMSPAESALWEQVTKSYSGRNVLAELDTAALQTLCEFWGLYQDARQKAKANPTDKEIRCAVVAYFGAFERLAGKFGLTPAARAALKVTPAKEKNVLAEFARKRS